MSAVLKPVEAVEQQIAAAIAHDEPYSKTVPYCARDIQGGPFEARCTVMDTVCEAIGDGGAAESALAALLALDIPEAHALRDAAITYWTETHADLIEKVRDRFFED